MAKSLKKNFILNMLLTMSAFVFPLITFPYVSRVLSPVGLGKVSLALSVITYFDLIAQLGIPIYGIHACAKVRDDREKLTRTAHELMVINLMTMLLSFIVLGVLLIVVPRFAEERMLYLIVSASMLLNAVGMDWLYKTLEQYTYITVRSLVFKIIALIGIFLLIRQPDDYVIYGAISIFATSASNLLNFICAGKHIKMRPIGGYRFKRHFKPILTFFAMACATTIYTNLDTVMLGFMMTDADVGYYNAAVKIKAVLVSVVTALGAVVLPRASFYVEQGRREEFWHINRKALNLVFLMAFPLALYFGLFAKESILLLSGEEYLASILPMQVIIPTLAFVGISNILGIQILVPLGRDRVVFVSQMIGILTDFVLNAIFIPIWGVAGAAFGTLVAEFVVLIIQLIALRKEISHLFGEIQYYKLLPALAVGVAASLWVGALQLGSFITLLISACLFFGAYGLVLLATRERLTYGILRQIVGRFRHAVSEPKTDGGDE